MSGLPIKWVVLVVAVAFCLQALVSLGQLYPEWLRAIIAIIAILIIFAIGQVVTKPLIRLCRVLQRRINAWRRYDLLTSAALCIKCNHFRIDHVGVPNYMINRVLYNVGCECCKSTYFESHTPVIVIGPANMVYMHQLRLNDKAPTHYLICRDYDDLNNRPLTVRNDRPLGDIPNYLVESRFYDPKSIQCVYCGEAIIVPFSIPGPVVESNIEWIPIPAHERCWRKAQGQGD